MVGGLVMEAARRQRKKRLGSDRKRLYCWPGIARLNQVDTKWWEARALYAIWGQSMELGRTLSKLDRLPLLTLLVALLSQRHLSRDRPGTTAASELLVRSTLHGPMHIPPGRDPTGRRSGPVSGSRQRGSEGARG